jgi:hypothetical protein
MAYQPSNPNGQATKANSSPVVIASDDDLQAKLGIVTETAPGTDTASSGLNGRLQRVAQRLTSLIALLPTTLGQTTKAGSLSITIASDQDALPITDNAGSLTVDNGGTFVVQENGAALTALQLLDDVVATDGAAAATKLYQVGGTDGTNAQILKTDTNGELQVDILTLPNVTLAANSGIDVGDVTINNTSGASAVNIQDGGNSITVDNNGTFVVQENGAALTALQLLDDTVVTDNAGFTDGTTKINMAGFIFDETAGTAITENDAAAARVDSKRAQVLVIEDGTTRGQRAGVTADGGLETVSIPHTSGGLTTYHLSSAATTNATVVKASAGQLYGWYIYNNNASMRKVAFHNSASTPTAGASIFMTLCIPGSSGENVMSDIGIAFSSGIAITTVTGAADNNATAVAADDLNINLFYK